MSPGDVIVRGRPDIVERIVCSPEGPANTDCVWCSEDRRDGLRRWHLEALYLGKAYSTGLLTDNIEGATLATPDDHEQARAYAERFNNWDREELADRSGNAAERNSDESGGARTGLAAEVSPATSSRRFEQQELFR